MANEKNLTGEPVMVETSDERLAAVEESKRTGDEFVSVGARGQQPVDRGILIEETRKVSNAGASQTSTLPKYLEELVDSVEDGAELNRQKAEQHSRYSAELARKQREARAEAQAKRERDPLYFAKLVQERNQKQVEEYNEKMSQYIKDVEGRDRNFNEEVQKISQEEAYSGDPVTEMGKRAKDFRIDESFANESLQSKDRIIYGAEDFLGGVADEQPIPEVDDSRKQEQPEDNPEEQQNDEAAKVRTISKSSRKEPKNKE